MLSKVLYDLKQVPKAWYERLSTFLIQNNFQRGNIDTNLFIQRSCLYIFIIQKYVDDIIFGSSNFFLCKYFVNLMKGESEMRSIENSHSSLDYK